MKKKMNDALFMIILLLIISFATNFSLYTIVNWKSVCKPHLGWFAIPSLSPKILVLR